MRIQIDIGHPGHVHLFKNFAWEMQKKGHEILFTCRDNEFVIYLLKKYQFKYILFGKKFNTTVGKIFGLIKFDLQSIITAMKFKPDLFMSHGSMYAAHASAFMRKPHISFEDTFNMEQVRLYSPFTEVILINQFKSLPLETENVITYKGYHELAYLHPNRFKPNKDIYKFLNLSEDEPYIILRFISWKASHDIGQKGLSLKDKEEIIKKLSSKGKIFILSEEELPINLQSYKINIPPERMHDALAFAQLFIGEGGTMASECAMLCTPSIHVSTLEPIVIKEQEAYGLLFDYSNGKDVLSKAIEVLDDKNFKKNLCKKRAKMLNEKIDVTSFMVWFIENYPKSIEICKNNKEVFYDI